MSCILVLVNSHSPDFPDYLASFSWTYISSRHTWLTSSKPLTHNSLSLVCSFFLSSFALFPFGMLVLSSLPLPQLSIGSNIQAFPLCDLSLLFRLKGVMFSVTCITFFDVSLLIPRIFSAANISSFETPPCVMMSCRLPRNGVSQVTRKEVEGQWSQWPPLGLGTTLE